MLAVAAVLVSAGCSGAGRRLGAWHRLPPAGRRSTGGPGRQTPGDSDSSDTGPGSVSDRSTTVDGESADRDANGDDIDTTADPDGNGETPGEN